MHPKLGKRRTRVAEDLAKSDWQRSEWLAKQYSADAVYSFC